MSKERNLLDSLLDDDAAKSWLYLTPPTIPDILDQKYPPLDSEYEKFGEEFEGIPTFQIPIILEAIRQNPDPMILSAMKDVLVLAKMTYSNGELDGIEYEEGAHNRHKELLKEQYNAYLSLHKKHLNENESGDTHIKRTFKDLLDIVVNYQDSDYTKSNLIIVCEILKALEVNHKLVFTDENFSTKLKILRTLDAYSLLKQDDLDLWTIMSVIRRELKDSIFGYSFKELGDPEIQEIVHGIRTSNDSIYQGSKK